MSLLVKKSSLLDMGAVTTGPGSNARSNPPNPLDIPAPYWSAPNARLYHGDALAILNRLPAEFVDCIVTSPPYYGQRDYGMDGQLGLEENPQLFLDSLLEVFHQAWRVLKPSGSLWVNIGDTYWSGKGIPHGSDSKRRTKRFSRPQDGRGTLPWCKPKQLLLIPHRFAIAMQDDGWLVRNDNVWHKPAPTPDPVDDRCATAHEYVFHFTKRRMYHYDSDAVAVPNKSNNRLKPPSWVWTIPTSTGRKKHLATFPDNLVRIPVRATCPQGGILLDPFCGSGTALEVAVREGRQAIGIDLDKNALDEATTLLQEQAGRIVI